ncbi:DUF5946 family protein [Actinocrispum sp. NPDC049592]|uniref:DUF5946 family protein n=1 Tax=Actinocrispum sp. NPDC049592 TaxID=3154835 RepID=UPI003421FCDE
MVTHRPDFHWLEPPRFDGLMTVADVLPADHTKLAWAWAADVWQAWCPHHPTIRTWNAQTPPDRT